jgi:hypothetical protein
MTNESLRALCLATEAVDVYWWPADELESSVAVFDKADAAYIAAMDPTTTLALLDRIAELEQDNQHLSDELTLLGKVSKKLSDEVFKKSRKLYTSEPTCIERHPV